MGDISRLLLYLLSVFVYGREDPPEALLDQSTSKLLTEGRVVGVLVREEVVMVMKELGFL